MFCHNLEVSLNLAFNFAKDNRHEFMTVEHLLLALCDNPDVMIVLKKYHVNIFRLKSNLKQYIQLETPQCHLHNHLEIQPTLSFQRVLQRAIFQVQSMSQTEVTGIHVLAAIFNEEDSQAAYLLNQEKLFRNHIMDFLQTNDHDTNQNYNDFYKDQQEISQEGVDFAESESIIEKYAKNLMNIVCEGEIDPLIGREEEVSRVIQVLCRRRKNNPLLIGEAGVGKTAIAEGLAKQILDKKVPKELENSVIYALDLGLLLAGTKYRGDFEKRFKDLLKELDNIPNAIIFIDEIHTIVGAGAASGGAMDAANLLKPLISKGNLRCMGATTYNEYRNVFEKDKALVRRFQNIDVKEPSADEAIKMLIGLKPYFENHHNIKYTDAAIKSAVELSVRYLHDRFLPDKAIDIIDEAGALQKILPKTKSHKIITEADIGITVAAMARVPVDKISNEDKSILLNLEKDLKNSIFGQDKAITTLVNAIKVSRSGLGDKNKPIGSFLFNGPTGVGKTEVCIQLAKNLGVELLRFDMSEYMEKHTVSQLIGAPAGYVGYEQGGQLTEAVAKHPYSLLLLDEIEKAHPDLLNILLQVMDNGELTDNNGKHINFRNVIIVMTSNTGAISYETRSLGFTEQDNKPSALEAVKKAFSPEFRNRLDAIVSFDPLDTATIAKIVDKFINELQEQLVSKGVKLSITASAKNWLTKHGYEVALGARPMRRLIDKSIKSDLADELIFGKLVKGGTVKIRSNGKNLELDSQQ